jgi:formamidopyrimidine-DNA glycosylase
VPELPEVESVRRQLAPLVTGRAITASWRDHHPSPRITAVADAVDRTIVDVRRRGKFLLCTLRRSAPSAASVDSDADRELVLHLGMTGSLTVLAAGTPVDTAERAHDRVRLTLDDGRVLTLRDPRRFGRVGVLPFGDHRSVPTLAALGPEPLSEDFDPDAFAARLAATRAPVKARLLDQRLVAGVGNIYADESLWRARIHPASRRVGRPRALALHAAVREVLAAAIEREGTTFRDHRLVNGASGRYLTELDAYGRAGRPCRRCGATMRRSVVAGRGTTSCPACQRV